VAQLFGIFDEEFLDGFIGVFVGVFFPVQIVKQSRHIPQLWVFVQLFGVGFHGCCDHFHVVSQGFAIDVLVEQFDGIFTRRHDVYFRFFKV